MPRARGNTYDRGNRFNTFVSGVTFQTSPSGTTIVKSGVTGSVVYGTTVKAATIFVGDAVKNSTGSGYTMPFLTTGLLAKVGQVANGAAGVTKADAAYFGLSSIYFCVASLGVTNLMNNSGTSAHVQVTTSKPIPAAGVSRVYFRVKNAAGAAVAKPCSIQYFAIGI